MTLTPADPIRLAELQEEAIRDGERTLGRCLRLAQRTREKIANVRCIRHAEASSTTVAVLDKQIRDFDRAVVAMGSIPGPRHERLAAIKQGLETIAELYADA